MINPTDDAGKTDAGKSMMVANLEWLLDQPEVIMDAIDILDWILANRN